jgi:hypothetical protein
VEKIFNINLNIMSLVVLSNNDADGKSSRQKQSVYKPWSFKNTLSSTYEIPANAQVALQSCKVNIDGRVQFSPANSKFFYYFGEKLDLDGVTDPQFDDTTSYPVEVDLSLFTDSKEVQEVSVSDFANVIQGALRQSSFHPNVKDQIVVDPLRNASSRDFLGYKFSFSQNNATTGTIPGNNKMDQFYRSDGVYEAHDDGTTPIFSYTGGIFRRLTDSPWVVASGLGTERPLSLNGGTFTVNISSTNASANASSEDGLEWHVGLSRAVNFTDSAGYYYPTYSEYAYPLADVQQDMFADFGVARSQGNELIAYHMVYDADSDAIVKKEVKYWLNASSDLTTGSRVNFSGTNYTQVKFTAEGERMKAEIYDNASSAWRVITQYSAGQPKDSMFKPINQACWCLHPVLSVGMDSTDTVGDNATLEISQFSGLTISGYDVTKRYKGGWYETREIIGDANRYCKELESRFWNNTADADNYTFIGLNASGSVGYSHVMVLQPSDIYKRTDGANGNDLLGFNRSIVDTPNTGSTATTLQTFNSTAVPPQSSPMSLFVRLNNFGQNCVNGRVGNHSKILAHLTNLETKTGRQTYEPSTLIYLDLHNPAPLRITEFDISFNYVNEQYATILSGQSICCLHFKAKDQ